MQVSTVASVACTSSVASVVAGPSYPALSAGARCRPDYIPLSLVPPPPAAPSSATASPSATPLYLATKLEPASLFAGDDVLRCVASTAALPRRLASTPLVANSQVYYHWLKGKGSDSYITQLTRRTRTARFTISGSGS